MSFTANTTGQAVQTATPETGVVTGEAIPRQHPAVVLRSRFKQLRALLAVALIPVAGLTAAVVILANDSDEVSTSSTASNELSSYPEGT
jgi:hypothetical protein